MLWWLILMSKDLLLMFLTMIPLKESSRNSFTLEMTETSLMFMFKEKKPKPADWLLILFMWILISSVIYFILKIVIYSWSSGGF
jgi:hypothetical protein